MNSLPEPAPRPSDPPPAPMGVGAAIVSTVSLGSMSALLAASHAHPDFLPSVAIAVSSAIPMVITAIAANSVFQPARRAGAMVPLVASSYRGSGLVKSAIRVGAWTGALLGSAPLAYAGATIPEMALGMASCAAAIAVFQFTDPDHQAATSKAKRGPCP